MLDGVESADGTIEETKAELIRGLISSVQQFRFCGPSDDPDEQTAVTVGFRMLVIKLKRLASPLLKPPVAARLNSIEVGANDLFSAYDANAELEAIFPDIEAALRVPAPTKHRPHFQPSFSPSTLKVLADVVSGGAGNSSIPPIGVYRTASQIEGFMMECDLDFRVGNMGSRVASLLGFLRTLASDDPEAGTKLTRVIERVAEPGDYAADPERQLAVISHLNRCLARDGAEITLHGRQPRLTELGRSGAVVTAISAKAATIDFDTVQRDIARALTSADDDPEDAVTILIELKLPLPAKKDIDGLVRAVQEPLGLAPGRADLPDEIAADIRQVLSGLTSTAKGIGALRTHAGDAHGRERGFKRIDGRIARLAIHGASTLALFLIETWERKQRRPLPQVEAAWLR